ncbi:MAG TPA: AmmeMemoRadiSam system protein A [Tepidisphaeraceae bacterium]|jgi:AmmeMemoRadiSam system protein A|nr:AmmeMemoRadiSam system protein A [Tepidisphaeraceae bacterium]
MEFSPRQTAFLLDTARAVIRATLAGQQVRPPPCGDLDLMRPAGCFASLHGPGGKLRGCVGRIDASEPLIAALTSAAVSVCSDGRFRANPVTLAELSQLALDLSILSPARPAANALDFDLLNQGIHLTIGGRAGCFLPQVARETGWGKEQLLGRLCTEKMGLPADSWKLPQAKLAAFSTVIVGPEPFERPNIFAPISQPIEAFP